MCVVCYLNETRTVFGIGVGVLSKDGSRRPGDEAHRQNGGRVKGAKKKGSRNKVTCTLISISIISHILRIEHIHNRPICPNKIIQEHRNIRLIHMRVEQILRPNHIRQCNTRRTFTFRDKRSVVMLRESRKCLSRINEDLCGFRERFADRVQMY
jgi:hypothetical protein